MCFAECNLCSLCNEIIFILKPAIKTIQSFNIWHSIAFIHLSRTNVANSISSYISFTNNKWLHNGSNTVIKHFSIFQNKSFFFSESDISVELLFNCSKIIAPLFLKNLLGNGLIHCYFFIMLYNDFSFVTFCNLL